MTDTTRHLGQNSPSPYTAGGRWRRALWAGVEATLFRWSPRACFGWRNFLLRAFGAEIAAGARVFPGATVYFPWKLRLGAHALVGPGVRIYNLADVTLGPGANLSRHIHVCAGTHDFLRWDMPLVTAPVAIGANVWVAADVFVGPGVTIGELAVVGARSVVVEDLPAKKICVGHPCRPIKDRPEPV